MSKIDKIHKTIILIIKKEGVIDRKDNLFKILLNNGNILSFNPENGDLFTLSKKGCKLYFREYHRVLLDEYENLINELQ